MPSVSAPLQPVDPAEVGRALADTAESEPSLAITQFAGPEVLSARELARRWRAATGSHAVPVRLPATRSLRAGGLTNPARGAARSPSTQWLRMNDLAERVEALRPRLLRLAYGQLGSLAEAEDVVQEAWLRLQRVDADEIRDLEGWMTPRSRGSRWTRCARRGSGARPTSARGCPSRSSRRGRPGGARDARRGGEPRAARRARVAVGVRARGVRPPRRLRLRVRRGRRRARRLPGRGPPARLAGAQGGRGAPAALPRHARPAARADHRVRPGRAEGDMDGCSSAAPRRRLHQRRRRRRHRGAQAARGRRPGRPRDGRAGRQGRQTFEIVDVNGSPACSATPRRHPHRDRRSPSTTGGSSRSTSSATRRSCGGSP